jgi:hypothetical protein
LQEKKGNARLREIKSPAHRSENQKIVAVRPEDVGDAHPSLLLLRERPQRNALIIQSLCKRKLGRKLCGAARSTLLTLMTAAALEMLAQDYDQGIAPRHVFKPDRRGGFARINDAPIEHVPASQMPTSAAASGDLDVDAARIHFATVICRKRAHVSGFVPARKANEVRLSAEIRKWLRPYPLALPEVVQPDDPPDAGPVVERLQETLRLPRSVRNDYLESRLADEVREIREVIRWGAPHNIAYAHDDRDGRCRAK